MPQYLKNEYRRYGAQLPLDIADIVDEETKRRDISAAQVITEQMRKALFGYGLCSHEEMAQLRRDQLSLLKASKHALAILYGDPKNREAVAQELAEFIVGATTRQPSLVAAEPPQSPYGSGGADEIAALAETALKKKLAAAGHADHEQADNPI